MAKTRGIFTACPPLVNFPSRRAQRSMLTTLALAFQISSRYATSACGSLPSGNQYVLVFFKGLNALDTEDIFVLGLVREKKSERF